jgi:hypothetical protein
MVGVVLRKQIGVLHVYWVKRFVPLGLLLCIKLDPQPMICGQEFMEVI